MIHKDHLNSNTLRLPQVNDREKTTKICIKRHFYLTRSLDLTAHIKNGEDGDVGDQDH